MAKEVVEFFLKQFTQEGDPTNLDLLNNVSAMVDQMVSQEIVMNIRLRGKPASMVIKLDMAKAYDRYSVLVNGQALGFFRSTREVKQGDPLSPALSVLSAEVLSRSLNKLFGDERFKGYRMPKWTDPLNHLAYADDTIIYVSTNLYLLRKVMEVLTLYEQTSGQLINKTKSSYYMYANVAGSLFYSVGAITGFQKGFSGVTKRKEGVNTRQNGLTYAYQKRRVV
ncbi:uncharacterized protein [Nicotiana tomentosiformis]|uniref:uncharacterized protein n=1 Tax=Nicotiana tomentosiformis TaxID=4098 RepID=UPI00388CA4A7